MARPTIGRWSTYTVLGLVGYLVGAIAVGVLANALGAGVAERVVAIAVPPFGFWFAVSAARRILHEERIVFYQAAGAAWASAVAVAAIAGMHVWRVSDLVIVLTAIFLAFGRVGCFHVACCHGRPARFGVRYSHAHGALGFPRRWVGRPVFPIQLVEAAASALLAIVSAGVALRASEGAATVVFVAAYAVIRFALELARGDSGRPAWRGLSEAQWIALACGAACAALQPSTVTIAAAGGLALAAVVVAVRARRPELRVRHPRHLDELERALATSRTGVRVCTSAGIEVSSHALPDRRVDVIWTHRELALAEVDQLARDLFAQPEVVAAARPGMFHVIVADS